jgi:hypothetical protein
MKILVKNVNPYLAINVGYGQKCNTFLKIDYGILPRI